MTASLATPIFESCTDMQILPCGVSYPVMVPIETMMDQARRLGGLITETKKLVWYAGDMIEAAERMHGEEGAQIIAEFQKVGLSTQYLRDAHWIAGRFPHAHRREALTPNHHKAVVALINITNDDPEHSTYFEVARSKLLLAEEKGWSAATLRQHVKEYIEGQEAKAKDEKPLTKEERIEQEYENTLMTCSHVVASLVSDLEDAANVCTFDDVVEFIKEWRP